MKQFKTVFAFEYLNYLRSRAYIVMSIIMLALIAGGASAPAIAGLFKGAGDGKPAALKKSAVYDTSGLYADDVLSAFLPGREWTRLGTLDGVEQRIEDGEFQMALAIDGLSYAVYEKQSSIAEAASGAAASIDAMVRAVYQSSALADAGLSQAESAAILGAAPSGEFITVGKNYFQNYWLGYIIAFLLYMSIMLYGQYVMTSVVTEKSSKAMELLVTSAKPMSLMCGKVFGTGCAGLTQFGAFMLCAAAALSLNLRGWEAFSPMVAGVVNSAFSAGILIYAVVFFLLGFFSFAFVYAGLGSTVSRIEDAGAVNTIPTFLIIVTFVLAMSGLMTPDALYVRVCSFVPFMSPMVMFVRICMTNVPAFEIALALALALNCAYLFGSGYVSAKIYRVGVMLYGKPPKLREIARYVRQA